ncbi:Subtilisin inhibitor-like [Blastococcus fimeti]|nr:Subtilisin inhibitor-like [Blastococcus fimeti]
MRRLLLLLVPAAVLALSACGSTDDGDGAAAPTSPATGEPTAPDPAAGGISQADNDLQLEIDLGDGSAPQTWTLTCVGFVEGSHPAAQAACDRLAGLERPFAPLPADTVCSQQYGGPETARVLGRWGGEPVDLALSRVDGCRIAQWDALVPVVPAPAG